MGGQKGLFVQQISGLMYQKEREALQVLPVKSSF